MKYIFTCLLLLYILPLSVYGQQTNSRNYIISRTYKQAGANASDVSKVVTEVRYIDGLGRPLQNVTVGQSPAGADIVLPVAYDGAGRQPKQYLPYVSTGNGAYQSAGITSVETWYLANSAGLQTASPTSLDLARPYHETVFEQSPLNRPSTQQGPGTRSRSGAIKYNVNTSGEIKRYDYDPAGNTITNPGTYSVGALVRTRYLDEQNRETNEYTDVLGQMICKSVLTGSVALYTYYIYDDMGLLRGVLQPNYQDNASLTDHAFTYDYDTRGRMTVKRVPGAGTTEIVYDPYDRPALSRDANQQARGVWGFTKYDGMNRAVMTGEITSATTRAAWQATLDAATAHHEESTGSGIGYTLTTTQPTSVAEANVLTVTYYDNYSFPKASNLGYTAAYYPSNNANVKGRQTGGRTRMLPGNGSAGGWLTSVVYFDSEYRQIQTVRELYDLGNGATERVSTQYKYDLAPVVSEQKTEQIVGGVTHSHLAVNSYDHSDRLLNVKETVTAGSKTKTAYTLAQRYNTLGQLQSKWFHGYAADPGKYRRRTNYTNNIRGWLTDAKTSYQQTAGTDLPFYALSLAYNNILYAAQYSNGNISTMQWSGKDETAFSGGLSFAYDGANRLLSAVKPTVATYTYVDTESGISYDKNGNIKTLNRAGASVDNLAYTYTGNRLTSINDASTASNTAVKAGGSNYSYDANGNMLGDGNRNATLNYNYLNLPKTVVVGGKTLTYDYDAGGNKHKYVADTLTVKYAGIFEYDANNVFKRVATVAGQVQMAKVLPSPASDTLRFDYTLKDHLGNVRVVFDEKGNILQKSDYYPFGLEIDRNSPIQPQNARNGINRYHYVGKETQVGSGYVDFTKRYYDPALARFLNVDLLAESYAHNGVYNYAENRPVDGIDLDGLEFYRTTDKSGSVTIGAKVRFENSSAANPQRVEAIKSNVQSTFNNVIGSANGSYKGQVDYDNNATLTISLIDKGDTPIGGISGNGTATATNNDFKNGNVIEKTVGQVGNTAVHELLHNAGLGHPTDVSQNKNGTLKSENSVKDTELGVKIKNGVANYNTTSNTASNIYTNVMVYGISIINGKVVNDVRGKPENANTMTPGQLNVVEENIKKGRVNGEASQN